MKQKNKTEVIAHSDRAHAHLSPSASSQWLKCPGSVNAIIEWYKNNPEESTTSPATIEGTFVHEVADYCLQNKIMPSQDKVKKQFAKKNIYNWDEIILNVKAYIRFVSREIKGTKWDSFQSETRVDLGRWIPDGFGTLDLAFTSEELIHIFDLKYGMYEVSAVENPQLMIYGLGFYDALTKKEQKKIETFKFSIAQPRVMNFSTYEITKKELLDFGKQVAKVAKLALIDKAPRKAGDVQCQFCAARTNCPEYANYVSKDLVDLSSNEYEFPAIDKMPDDKLRKIIENKKMIMSFIELVEKTVKDRIIDGQEFEGYKVVESRKRKKFHEGKFEELAKKYKGQLHKDPAPKNMTEIQKIVTGAEFDAATFIPEGDPTLAPSDDKRPEYKGSLISQFKD